MQGSWNNGKPHNRCTFRSSCFWRSTHGCQRKFDAVAFTSAVREFEAAHSGEPELDEGAQQEIAECDAKLRQHRAALEAGADPVPVTSWMKETQARRALAAARLKKPARRRRMSDEEIMNLVTELGGIMEALKEADLADKAEIYRRIGLTLTYHPQEKRVAAEARPNSIMYVGTCPRTDSHLTYMIDIALTTEFILAVDPDYRGTCRRR